VPDAESNAGKILRLAGSHTVAGPCPRRYPQSTWRKPFYATPASHFMKPMFPNRRVALSIAVFMACACMPAGSAFAVECKAAQDSAAEARLTRGKKLVLKNGDFQLVRSYERKGDRVRYLSAERGEWEEIPAALVDWDATKRAETDS